jgi:alpha-glucosidase
MAQEKMLWWQSGIIYQIYPRSFQDSDGDGIGDLQGIIQRLDYLEWLGITAIWISPLYPSPMADFGYDISDYTGIHPLFGSMDDFDALLQQAHAKNIRVILDLVPNHTSDMHPWFIESRSSKNNPRRDWYIWSDASADGSPPNNWLSVFGGSAWEWDETTQQYYYHAFLKEQPDLNWRNPEVQHAMMQVMRFWLDKGVDGFRVDVMWHMIKDDELRNNPANPDYKEHQATYEQLIPLYTTNQPEVHVVVHQMRRLLNEYNERMMVGEIYLPIQQLVQYYGPRNDGAHLPFNFLLLSLPWKAQAIAAAIEEYEGSLPPMAWPNWVLGNHDQPRIASRVGPHQLRVAAMLLLTLRGTPTIYYGDELGMQNVPIPPEEVQDPQGLNMPDKNLSRDPSRTPMQWTGDTFAGFSTTRPWLRLADDYKAVNVDQQTQNPQSHLHFYRRLIKLRQSQPSLMWGDYQTLYVNQQALAYTRKAAGETSFLILLNFSQESTKMNLETIAGTVVLATSTQWEGKDIKDEIQLGADEGLIVAIK